MIYIGIILFISFLYLRIFVRYKIYWDNIQVIESDHRNNFISVIISCRNEERNIEEIISDIFSQNFDDNKFELIIVDDHSDDNTINVLNSQKEIYKSLRVISLDDSLNGKINAIKRGVSESRGDIILCTDADCRVGPNWIRTIQKYFINSNTMFVLGPVENKDFYGIFYKFQSLEMISLVTSSASAISGLNPIFCNGANLAFRKSVYQGITSQERAEFITDDVSLLFYVHNRYPEGISFIKEYDAVITTKQPSSFISYISQRLRWIHGFRNESSFTSRYIAIVVFLMSLLICISSLSVFVDLMIINLNYPQIYFGFYVIILIKFISDSIFLYRPLIFFNKTKLLFYVLPFQIIYAFYVLLIVTLSFVPRTYRWKDRVMNDEASRY